MVNIFKFIFFVFLSFILLGCVSGATSNEKQRFIDIVYGSSCSQLAHASKSIKADLNAELKKNNIPVNASAAAVLGSVIGTNTKKRNIDEYEFMLSHVFQAQKIKGCLK